MQQGYNKISSPARPQPFRKKKIHFYTTRERSLCFLNLRKLYIARQLLAEIFFFFRNTHRKDSKILVKHYPGTQSTQRLRTARPRGVFLEQPVG